VAAQVAAAELQHAPGSIREMAADKRPRRGKPLFAWRHGGIVPAT
jgi:hypothetical protein